MAADAYAANGLPGEAAAERLMIAGYLQSAGLHRDAAATAQLAGEEATRAERVDLRARALGLQGVARVKGGVYDDGVEIIRAGLSLALEHELTVEAAEVYQRLGTAHEITGDYGGARDALGTAIGLCERGDAGAARAGVRELHGLRAARLGRGRRALRHPPRARCRARRDARRRPAVARPAGGSAAAARALPGDGAAPRRRVHAVRQRRRTRRARHALAEVALAEGDLEVALEHVARALALHDDLDIPFERAQILLPRVGHAQSRSRARARARSRRGWTEAVVGARARAAIRMHGTTTPRPSSRRLRS